MAPTGVNIDKCFNDLVAVIKTHEKSVPRSRYRKYVKSFWCAELGDLKRQKVEAYRNWTEHGKPRDPTNPFYISNKEAKKAFRKRIKRISSEYDDEKIKEAIEKAELDKNIFWKMLKRERDGPRVKTPSIKNPEGKVQHDVHEILKVWEEHFSNVTTV